MKNKVSIIFFFLFSFSPIIAQEEVLIVEEDSMSMEVDVEFIEEDEVETFGGTRIINGHSVETLGEGVLEFRIEHRFGDIAGGSGGVQTLFGFDNSTDIRFGFEYGITDKFMIGFGRSKGTGAMGTMGSPYKALLDGFAKYRVLRQNSQTPISLSLLGAGSYTYMKAIDDVYSVAHFPKMAHRFAYTSQINIARKFGSKLSLSLMPTFVYRNYVAADDVNALFSLGSAVRYSLNSKVGIIVEYYQNIHDEALRTQNTNSLGIAIEWMTFGHTFTINLTNSVGFGETQFIPYTFQSWSKGQFRLGFCIGRKYMRE
jgi:hypothetical protein